MDKQTFLVQAWPYFEDGQVPTMRALAKALGISKSSVQRWCRLWGIEYEGNYLIPTATRREAWRLVQAQKAEADSRNDA